MTDLSPQAQAIVDAFNGYHEMVNRRVKIAAVLCEVVNQLKYIGITEKNILSIAKELEQI
jgi:hypothetical protein